MNSQAVNGILITMVLALIITAVVFIIIDSSKKHHHGHHPPSPPPHHHRQHQIGNDRDKHGCLISGGYKWCHPKKRCIKPWEESC
tara:strand:+ start:167 stop:421 length:255 start_codon:yes stop_codon:yes gene_type:complete